MLRNPRTQLVVLMDSLASSNNFPVTFRGQDIHAQGKIGL